MHCLSSKAHGIVIIFLLTTLLSSAYVLPAQTAGQTAEQRPNIVFVLTDDLDAHPDILDSMPNLKQLLISHGLTFANSYVAMPLCCPSRASTLTGRFVHNHGTVSNRYPGGGYQQFFENGQETNSIGLLLQNAGYRTALFGTYLNQYPRLNARNDVPPGWTEWYVILDGHRYYDYTMLEKAETGPAQQYDYGSAPADYSTDVMARQALDFLTRSASDFPNTPFFIEISPLAPHDPGTEAPRHTELFPRVTAPRSPSFDEANVSDKPTWVQELPRLTVTVTHQIDLTYRNRLRSLQAVDEMIGQFVQKLADNEQLSNTYFVFSSDNGWHTGQHRIPLGKTTPYEESVRVPLIVRGPGIAAATTRSELVSNIDLAPTFAEIAGLNPADIAWFDGRSLLPLLHAQGPAEGWRHVLLFENPASKIAGLAIEPLPSINSAGQLVDGDGFVMDPQPAAARQVVQAKNMPPYYAMRTQRYKYIEYTTGERELYDLSQDPYELNNLATTASTGLLNRLADQLAALKLCSGSACRLADLPTPLATSTVTPTFTHTPTHTPTEKPTAVATVTLTPSPSPTATRTPVPGATATTTPLPSTPTPGLTVTLLPTPEPTGTPTPLPGATVTTTPLPLTATPVPTITLSSTPTPTAQLTPTCSNDNKARANPEQFTRCLFLPIIATQ